MKWRVYEENLTVWDLIHALLMPLGRKTNDFLGDFKCSISFTLMKIFTTMISLSHILSTMSCISTIDIGRAYLYCLVTS